MFVVATDVVGLEDIVAGELRVRVDSNAALVDVDLSKVDLDWASKNLYDSSPNNFFIPTFEGLTDDAATEEQSAGPARGFFGSIGSAVGGFAEKVGEKVADTTTGVVTTTYGILTQAVSANFTGSGDFTSEVSGEAADTAFVEDVNYVKTKRSKKGRDIDIAINVKRLGLKSGRFKLNPGIQFSASVPNKLSPNAGPLSLKLDIAARSELDLVFDYDIQASVRTRPGVPFKKVGGSDSELLLSEEEAGDVYDTVNAALFGDPDFKLPQGFRKLLYITKPKIMYVQAGPAPVVITFTVQFDLQCGIMAKGTVQGTLGFKHAGSFVFSGGYAEGAKENMTPPTFAQATKMTENTIDGGGELTVSCGIVPRVNSLLYDTLGLGVGVRSSIGTKITPNASCPGVAPNPESPKNQLNFEFTAELAAQLTGRAQVPGASALQKEGAKLGVEVGPVEPYFKSFPLGKLTTNIGTKFGYCPGTRAAEGGIASGEPTVSAAGTKVTATCGAASVLCAAGSACRANSDCARPAACVSGVCSTDTCSNGVSDGLETGVDCGGSCATKCGAGGGCKTDEDCAAGTCSLSSAICVTDHCTDSKYNADEAGIDCGGSCSKKCKNGDYCFDASGQSCESGYVYDYRCVAGTCHNGVKDGDESGIDCGGASTCIRCNPGSRCVSNADCQPGNVCRQQGDAIVCTAPDCSAVKGVPPACNDSVKNCAETDADCGGARCGKCDTGRGCLAASDCASGVCNGGVCSPASCVDLIKNGTESDVDCGVGCSLCAQGKACSSGADCASASCVSGVCAAPTCQDNAKNGNETDSDCGGPDCPKCSVMKLCSAPSDCELNYCIGGTCRDSSCSDLLKNGRETDVDCGGPDCPRCGNNLACAGDLDCFSLVCTSMQCQAPTCVDTRKNGAETDLNCGGPTCPDCAVGQSCGVDGDCASGVCNLGVCVAPGCTDLVQNGDETDVDCGGPDCNKCIFGKSCMNTSDCVPSGICSADAPRVCVDPSWCADGMQNYGEDAVDCGGDVCSQHGLLCNAANTAATTNCSGIVGLDNIGFGNFSIRFSLTTTYTDVVLGAQRATCTNTAAAQWMVYVGSAGHLYLMFRGADGTTLFMNSPNPVNDGYNHTIRLTRFNDVFYMSVDYQTVATQLTSAGSRINFTGTMPPVQSGAFGPEVPPTAHTGCGLSAFVQPVGIQYLGGPTVCLP